MPRLAAPLLVILTVVACGEDRADRDGGASLPDGSVAADAGPPVPASTTHCDYAAMAPTPGAGGVVAAGAVSAGAAEAPIEVPIGATLGAYTARAGAFGGSDTTVDARVVEMSGSFNPSIGIETIPKLRAVAITAGEETVVLLKIDAGIADENLAFRVSEELGPEYAGKVLLLASHSHSGFGHFATHSGMQVGFGAFRSTIHEALIAQLVAVVRAALEARVPARIGIAHDPAFDPDDRVTRDRRGENDELAGGSRDDHHLFVVRIDAIDGGRPIAILPVFGMHGTLLGADNQLASTDAPGGVERAIEEAFDEPVVVMHLQGAGGDVSPAGTGGTECGEGPCYRFARAESVGRWARDMVLTAWEDAGAAAEDTLAVEMVTRPIALGPDWDTFTVRDGALRYAAFDGRTEADGRIFGDDGAVLSPVDEFNAPVGAALCGEDHDALFPMGQLPGTRRLRPYRSCLSVDVAADILGGALELPFEPTPVCGSTRTVLSALRLGDWLLVALPGEPLTLFAEHVRSLSPIAPERTVVLGYANDNLGYLMTAEDWLAAGYEPSINFWGPLEGEYVAAQAAALMELAVTDVREDATEGAVGRWVPPAPTDDLPPVDPAPMAGTVPATVPPEVYVRGGEPLASARPPASIQRLDVVRMAWIGADPMAGTPRVTLQRETAPGSGVFVDVVRRSGRAVRDQDLLLLHTPSPLVREGDAPRTHYWVVEWQAVVPWGTPGLDDLEDRAGLPLGRYRFSVDGPGYTVEGDAFEVHPAGIAAGATREGAAIRVTVGYDGSGGFRLLDATARSDAVVPLRRGPLTVEIGFVGGTSRTETVDLAGPGEMLVTPEPGDPEIERLRIEDRFGNFTILSP